MQTRYYVMLISMIGYVYLKDSVVHTAGVGSAVAYALGLINADNVLGLAENVCFTSF